jgi:hypothetical protein
MATFSPLLTTPDAAVIILYRAQIQGCVKTLCGNWTPAFLRRVGARRMNKREDSWSARTAKLRHLVRYCGTAKNRRRPSE